jgi:hypothetical protein
MTDNDSPQVETTVRLVFQDGTYQFVVDNGDGTTSPWANNPADKESD